jgi:hypothetical protein
MSVEGVDTSKGVAVRRLAITLFIIVVSVLAIGVTIGATGCGTSAQSAAVPSASLSPEGILAEAVAASQNMTSAKGSFEIAVSFDADLSQLPEEQKALIGQPIKVSGTLAYASEPRAGDLTLGVSAAGQAMDIGFKLLGDQAWVRFMDQWYETPPEMQQVLGGASGQNSTTTDVQRLLGDLGVDPATWMTGLRMVGEETLNGVAAYHLAASPDITTMMTDLMKLIQSPELTKLLDATGSAGALEGASPSLPAAGELQDMQKQLESMFQDLAVDLWIAKDGFAMLKVAAGARMTPLPGQDASGLNAIRLSATVSLQDINEPVSVEAPASAKPFADLQKAMEDNPGTFMGLFSGALAGVAAPLPTQ